jgi:hypothetical protein
MPSGGSLNYCWVIQMSHRPHHQILLYLWRYRLPALVRVSGVRVRVPLARVLLASSTLPVVHVKQFSRVLAFGIPDTGTSTVYTVHQKMVVDVGVQKESCCCRWCIL